MRIQAMFVLGALALGLTTTLPAQAAAGAKVSFQRQILPILEASCSKCHKATYKDARGRRRKPKSGLRLDGKGWILKGGKGGVALVPGKPKDSPLYTLTTLGPDDDDVMPSKGKPLTRRQTELLRRWIVEGCDFGAWVGKAGPGEAVVAAAQEAAKGATLSTRRLATWQRLGKGMRAPLPQAIQRAAGKKCQVVPISPGSPLLRVAFVSNEASVGDQDLQNLVPLVEHITQLGLAKTRITDAALDTVGRMKKLTRLDLNRTDISDAGLRRLSALTELRYLNLHSTGISDAGIRAIGQLANLESVYLWNTKVTEVGIDTLRFLRPTLRISYQLQIPVVEKEPRSGSSSRRRRE